MDWERMKERLEPVIGAPTQTIRLSESQWKAGAAARGMDSQACLSIVHDSKVCFFLNKESDGTTALAVDEVLLTRAERQLVELILELNRSQGKKAAVLSSSEDEKRALLIRDWCLEHLETGRSGAEMPEALFSQMSLHSVKVPVLLTGEYSPNHKVSYRELKKLLESFFDAEIILIPLLEKEWLILGSESLLAESDGYDKDGGDRIEDALTLICSGLHDMLANEWVGECHLAVHYPMTPVKSLISSIIQLRETMQLGRAFHVGGNIHLPWELRLEKLLYAVPDHDKVQFLEQALGGFDHLLDAETLSTLEMFFTLDCNVSETAKKLYIHRNTLLYRLDKFKQETGLDVRNFSDAVLVNIAFLLYKVTKRK